MQTTFTLCYVTHDNKINNNIIINNSIIIIMSYMRKYINSTLYDCM